MSYEPLGSVGIFLTAVESRACAMWCCEVTDSGLLDLFRSVNVIGNIEGAKLKQRLIFSIIMSLVLSSMMSGWVTYLNLGLSADYFSHWFNSFLLAWPAAGAIAFVCGPEVQKLSKYLADKV